MGVHDLLPFVGTAFEEALISQFCGAHLAVDASCWLHRGAHSCAADVANQADCERAAQTALGRWGRIDVLVQAGSGGADARLGGALG